jgi:hypothetical protein
MYPPLSRSLCNNGGFGGAYPATLQASLATSWLLHPHICTLYLPPALGGPGPASVSIGSTSGSGHGGGQRQTRLVPYWEWAYGR